MWEGKHPLAFQMFHNSYWDKKPPSISANIAIPVFQKELESFYELFLSLNNLSHLTHLSRTVVQPFVERKYACTMVLCLNIAQPEWIAVDCNKTYLTYVLCRDNKFTVPDMQYCVECEQQVCSHEGVVNSGRCYKFIWFDNRSFPLVPLPNVCDRKRLLRQANQNISEWINLLKAVDYNFPDMLTIHKNYMSTLLVHTFRKFMNEFSSKSVPVNEASGFVTCLETIRTIKTFGNLFSCSNKSFVSIKVVCDDLMDCPHDDADEQNCTCKTNMKQRQNFTQKESSWVERCENLYFSSSYNRNLLYAPETKMIMQNVTTTSFVCLCGKAILEPQWNDLIPDCGPDAEDEPSLLVLLRGTGFFRCSDPNQIPCKPGHPTCYNISNICSYLLDHILLVKPCRNGAHIQDCELFKCNMRFKCHQSYCIQWSYLCNGRWDCPDGQEEQNESCKKLLHCVGMFKCKQEPKTCMHLGSICDGFIDCKLGEDESLCELEHVKCPQGCDCLALAIHCDSVNQFSLWQNYPFIAASIYNSPSLKCQNFLSVFAEIKFFSFHNSSCDTICGFDFPSDIISFALQFNLISELEKDCIQHLSSLAKVLFAHNKIAAIESQSFLNLTNLKFISLSNNPLSLIEKDFVSGTPLLQVIFLEHVHLTFLAEQSFHSASPRVVIATNYSLCCVTPDNTICTTVIPWYVSCKQLFSSITLRITCISISAILVFVIITSVIVNKVSKDSNQCYKKMSYMINSTDLLCLIFLFILWIKDVSVSENIMDVTFWRTRILCKICFLFIFSFAIFTQLSSLLLVTSRLMIVLHPMKTKFKRSSFVMKCIACLVGLGCTISFSVGLTAVLTMQEIPNAVCSPFADPTKVAIVITFIVVFTTVTQCISGIAIAILHIIVVHKLKESQQQNLSKTVTEKNTALVTQVSLLTLCPILCWYSTNAAKTTILFLSKFPVELIEWKTVMVIPLCPLLTSVILSGKLLIKHFDTKQRKPNIA